MGLLLRESPQLSSLFLITMTCIKGLKSVEAVYKLRHFACWVIYNLTTKLSDFVLSNTVLWLLTALKFWHSLFPLRPFPVSLHL